MADDKQAEGEMVFTSGFALNSMIQNIKVAKDEKALTNAIERVKGFIKSSGSVLDDKQATAMTTVFEEQKKGSAWTPEVENAVKALNIEHHHPGSWLLKYV